MRRVLPYENIGNVLFVVLSMIVPDDWECPDCDVGKDEFKMGEV